MKWTSGSAPGCEERKVVKCAMVFHFIGSSQWFGWIVRYLERIDGGVCSEEIWGKDTWLDFSERSKYVKISASHRIPNNDLSRGRFIFLKGKDNYHLLVHFSGVHNIWDWARPKPWAWELILGLPMGIKDLRSWAITWCFLGCELSGSSIGNRARTQNQSFMVFRCFKLHLNHCAKCHISRSRC